MQSELSKNAERQRALRAKRVKAGKKQVNFYLSNAVISKIDQLKLKHGITRDDVVMRAVRSLRLGRVKKDATK